MGEESSAVRGRATASGCESRCGDGRLAAVGDERLTGDGSGVAGGGMGCGTTPRGTGAAMLSTAGRATRCECTGDAGAGMMAAGGVFNDTGCVERGATCGEGPAETRGVETALSTATEDAGMSSLLETGLSTVVFVSIRDGGEETETPAPARGVLLVAVSKSTYGLTVTDSDGVGSNSATPLCRCCSLFKRRA
jgi:hypothetical protein